MRWAVGALMLVAAACSSTGERETLTVFAASSLDVAFEDLGDRFEDLHPGVDVVLSLAGSQTLATQIESGAEPDVFASADEVQMERALAATPADIGPVTFATNRLVIAVTEGNPHGITTVEDLARNDLVVALGAEEVPVGRYSREVLEAAGVEPEVASREVDVGFVLTKVGLGEADAGLVYQSDLVRSDGAVEGVEIPSSINVTAAYPIAGWGAGMSAEFVEFVMSEEGREALRTAGFEA